MASTIKLRRGSGTPTAGEFQVGEPAWDSTNGVLYVKNTAGAMVQINQTNADYGLITGAVDGSLDYGALS